ncbi:MAG TPA: hypothetical protein VH309_08540 [Elusimicrobiota bacterium]|nr:hypothetical protein [Elusimicrobiota bacterium]
MPQPVKIADRLMLDARLAAKIGSRSIAGQIEYWAHLGEALEPLLRGDQVLALLKAGAEKPLSASLASVDGAQGRRRVIEHLKQQPFPHYAAAPRRPGMLVRIDEDGTRTVGRFVRRRFVAAA